MQTRCVFTCLYKMKWARLCRLRRQRQPRRMNVILPCCRVVLKSVGFCTTMLPSWYLTFKTNGWKMLAINGKNDEGGQNSCCIGCGIGLIFPVKCRCNRGIISKVHYKENGFSEWSKTESIGMAFPWTMIETLIWGKYCCSDILLLVEFARASKSAQPVGQLGHPGGNMLKQKLSQPAGRCTKVMKCWWLLVLQVFFFHMSRDLFWQLDDHNQPCEYLPTCQKIL